MFTRVLLLIIFLFLNFLSYAQSETSTNRLSPNEFAIPASPVFDIMGETPSQINRTADIKDFKVDWSFKSWRLNPNLAIQFQPFWDIIYNRKDLSKYQNAFGFMRKLASLDFSVGSVQDENTDRRIGFDIKTNLLRKKELLMEKELYVEIGELFKIEKNELENKLVKLRFQLDTTVNIFEKPTLRSQIKDAEGLLLSSNSRRNAEINDRAKLFISKNWNATSVDIAFGRVYSYQTDSAGTLKSLWLIRNTTMAGWLNAIIGIDKRILISGLLRNSWYEEELNFLFRNNWILRSKFTNVSAQSLPFLNS